VTGTGASAAHVRADTGRAYRTGMPEAVYAETKTAGQCREAFLRLLEAGVTPVIATRIDSAKAQLVASSVPDTTYDPVGRVLVAGGPAGAGQIGSVAILSGGTSDLPVVRECAMTLAALGAEVDSHVDVGVAGLHRLLDVLPELVDADVLIAVAGMEGALPTVLAGLVPQPVIAVPTGVGYGVSSGGHAALTGMLASCAPGLMVVNIDNGFGAAAAALRILKAVNRGAPRAEPARVRPMSDPWPEPVGATLGS
jgi:NCAIR mutase (PurE)-related protein